MNGVSTEIAFTVYGKAEPAGSKTAMPLYGRDGAPITKNGRVLTNTVDANKKSPAWKTEVKDAARAAYDGPQLTGPVVLSLIFYRGRIKSHFRSNGQLKPTAPHWCETKPDVLKLARGVEDAITQAGNIWRDDSQVVCEYLSKIYCELGDAPRVEVAIRPLS